MWLFQGTVYTTKPAGMSLGTPTSSSLSTSTPTTNPTPNPAGASSDQNSQPSSSNSTGAIAGAVVGGVLGLALIIYLVWWFGFKRKKNAFSPPTAPVEIDSQPGYYAHGAIDGPEKLPVYHEAPTQMEAQELPAYEVKK